jgi:hypothetical protein
LRRARRNNSWADIKSLLKVRMRAKRNQRINPQPPVLFRMATGYWLSQAIYVAAKLGIADLLADSPQSSTELALALRVDESSLFRVLRVLTGAGILSHTGGDYFALEPMGEPLLSDVHGSLRSTLITLGEIHYQAWGELLHSVRTGSPAFDHALGVGLFEYLQHNQADAAAFDEGMSNLADLLSYAVLCAYDLSGVRHLMDIGGGHGTFLRNVLKINPRMKGTVFDMASTVEFAQRRQRRNVYCERLAFVSGDFFIHVPKGADAHLLSGVIHDWSDERAITILRNCREAIPPHGQLLLVEMVVPEGGSYCFSKLLDLNMLVMTGGRERTEADFSRLLNASGYRLVKVIPTLAPQSLIVGVPK